MGCFVVWGGSCYSVGYGDVLPQTSGGKIVAALLMIFGFILFGTLTASLSLDRF